MKTPAPRPTDVDTPMRSPDTHRGLGDTVAKVIKTVSMGRVRPCGGCKKRQAALNAMFPYQPPPAKDK
jgi:hypothetical protein